MSQKEARRVYVAVRFQRLKRLKGKKALVAPAHTMLAIIYHMLKDKTRESRDSLYRYL